MNFRKNNPYEGLTMPYDKETQDALQVYYETQDFTASITAQDLAFQLIVVDS